MLSENLRALHSRLANYAHDGVQLVPDAVIGICAILDEAVHDARALEGGVVPEHLRVARGALPHLYGTNVVPFFSPAPARRDFSPDGGQAA